jgi:hypothetical protein
MDAVTKASCATGWGADLSCGGIGFFSAAELPLQTYVVVEFELNGATVRLQACIMRRSGTRYGAEFLQVPEATRLLIERALRACTEAH